MAAEFPIPVSGDAEDGRRIVEALREVVDPEMSLNIVDLGLVYGIDAGPSNVRVALTMTSAACPVAELIVDDVHAQLASALPGRDIRVDLTWDPPWTPERMSERARRTMGWD